MLITGLPPGRCIAFLAEMQIFVHFMLLLLMKNFTGVNMATNHGFNCYSCC
jgi:hypothetical protein